MNKVLYKLLSDLEEIAEYYKLHDNEADYEDLRKVIDEYYENEMKNVVENYKDAEKDLFCIVGNLIETEYNLNGYCTGLIRGTDKVTAIVQIVRGNVRKFDFTYGEMAKMAKKLNIEF